MGNSDPFPAFPQRHLIYAGIEEKTRQIMNHTNHVGSESSKIFYSSCDESEVICESEIVLSSLFKDEAQLRSKKLKIYEIDSHPALLSPEDEPSFSVPFVSSSKRTS